MRTHLRRMGHIVEQSPNNIVGQLAFHGQGRQGYYMDTQREPGASNTNVDEHPINPPQGGNQAPGQ